MSKPIDIYRSAFYTSGFSMAVEAPKEALDRGFDSRNRSSNIKLCERANEVSYFGDAIRHCFSSGFLVLGYNAQVAPSKRFARLIEYLQVMPNTCTSFRSKGWRLCCMDISP
jgi:hypothetical protein